MGGETNKINLYDVEEDESTLIPGHTARGLPWLSWLDDGKKALTTDSNETLVWDSSDLSNPTEWPILMKVVGEKFFPLLTYNRTLTAFIYKR